MLKVLTYNIRHGKGLDDKVSLGRVAAVIAASGADLAALQEVDGYTPRSGFRCQAVTLGRRLKMRSFYGATLKAAGLPVFGNAILSGLPVRGFKRWVLPGKGEQRGLTEVTIADAGTQWSFLTTHLGLSVEARVMQVGMITEVLDGISRPFILTGDFNCLHDAEELAPLYTRLRDAALEADRTFATFPAGKPEERIDFVFVSPHWVVHGVKRIDSEASDHLPVLAILELLGT
ncbi:MAG: endonuclease/exonuclease/phosphatase family protein [Bacillota bacterium]